MLAPDMPICLTKQEIKEITGRHQYSAQGRELAKMGIEYRIRCDGSLMVLRASLPALPDAVPPPLTEPDFSSIG